MKTLLKIASIPSYLIVSIGLALSVLYACIVGFFITDDADLTS